MALRNILVHLDGCARTQERLNLAAAIARRNGARITGVFAQMAKAQMIGVISNKTAEAYEEKASAAQAAFEAATQGLNAQWQDLKIYSETEILRAMTDLSRVFDLVILGQIEDEVRGCVPEDLVEQLVVESGRPVLVVPYAGHFPGVGRRPLFAWTEARAAARALNDAIPLIEEGADVLVVSVDQPKAHHGDVEQLIKHLETHGIPAQFQRLVVEDIGLMDTLLNRAADHSADLLAIGAFGAHGIPFISRGNGTRYMLRHMTMPVLFSH